MKRLVLAGVLLGLAAAREAAACTTFCIRHGQELVFGKNYDFVVGDGLVLVNKRGLAKTASDARPPLASWVSKYGSVTFNQFGREQPNGGMNEAGLVVELMWLDDTEYPARDERPELGSLEWIQYQLDRFATVDEVLEAASTVRIWSEVPLHYLVCDRSGRCAAVEFLKGRLVPHAGEELPVTALANDTYEASLRHLRGHPKSTGPTNPTNGARGPDSLDRFATAGRMAQAYRPSATSDAVGYAFDMLARVAQGAATRWSIVYDLVRRQVHFRTLTNKKIRRVSLEGFDFSCASPVKSLDLAADLEGDVTARFAAYTRAQNRALVGRVYPRVPFLAGISRAELREIARYPESFACTEAAAALQKGR